MRSCENPREVPGFGLVRCGRCPSCRDLRAFLKRTRVALEQAGHAGEKAWFCTLTFANADPTKAEKESYADVQLWLKRVRQKLAYADILKEGLRYVGVAEFGTLHGRLHYHVLLWSPVPLRRRDIASWHRGQFDYRVADESRWEYLLKYLQKQSGTKIRGSTKLGHAYVEQVASHDMVRSSLAAFPGSRILRIGNRMVPRDIAGKHVVPIVPSPLTEDEEFIRSASASELRAKSERTSLVGMTDETWEKLIEDQRARDHDYMSGARRPRTYRNIEDERSDSSGRDESGNRGGEVPPDEDV